METKIKTKKDAENYIKNNCQYKMLNYHPDNKKHVLIIPSSDFYYGNRKVDKLYIYDNGIIKYNFKNENSELLNSVEISKQDAINIIFKNRKYINKELNQIYNKFKEDDKNEI
jgi:monomeric isocitrate dehydrogenase